MGQFWSWLQPTDDTQATTTTNRRKRTRDELNLGQSKRRKMTSEDYNNDEKAGDTKKPKASTETEFEEFAKHGTKKRFENTRKPHIMMGNIEKAACKKEVEKYTQSVKRLSELMECQSRPSALDLLGLSQICLGKANVIRAATFQMAAIFKMKIEKIGSLEESEFCSERIQNMFNWVQSLHSCTDSVLDINLLSNGAHGHDIAEFIIYLMQSILDQGFPSTNSKGNAICCNYAHSCLHIAYAHIIVGDLKKATDMCNSGLKKFPESSRHDFQNQEIIEKLLGLKRSCNPPQNNRDQANQQLNNVIQ